MFNLYLGFILIIILILGAIFSIGVLDIFIDLPSLVLVCVGAILYSFAAGGDKIDKIDNIGYGAVRMGWIGLIIGIISITSNGLLIDLGKFGPAFAIAMLTVFYGYLIQILTNMIVIKMENNDLEKELD